VGLGPRVRDWAVVSGGDGEAHYCGRRFAPLVAVRLLSTRRPAHQLYDLWARAHCVRGWVALVHVRRDGRERESLPCKGIHPACSSYTFAFSPVAAPFRLRALRAPLHSRRRSHHGLVSPSRALPVRGGVQLGVQPARMGCVGVRRKDPRRRLSPRRSRRRGVRALRLLPLLWVGATDLAFLPAAAGEARPPTSAPHAPLHSPGGHLRPPLGDVRGGGASSASARAKGCCAATFQRWKAS
jgi:hypothetical protein